MQRSWFIYFYRRCTCFRQLPRPSSGAHNCTYSFRYCQPVLLFATIVDLIHDSSKQQNLLTIPEAVCTVMCSWWWAEEPPETCTASVEINKSRNVASCWLYFGIIHVIRWCYTTNWLHVSEAPALMSSIPYYKLQRSTLLRYSLQGG